MFDARQLLGLVYMGATLRLCICSRLLCVRLYAAGRKRRHIGGSANHQKSGISDLAPILAKNESVAKAVDVFDDFLLRTLAVLRNLPAARLIFISYLGACDECAMRTNAMRTNDEIPGARVGLVRNSV